MSEALERFRQQMRDNAPPPVQGPPTPLGTIYSKRQERIARPGSQRRCYNGCFPDSDWEMVWTGWEEFLSNRPKEDLAFWQGLSKDKKYKWEINT